MWMKELPPTGLRGLSDVTVSIGLGEPGLPDQPADPPVWPARERPEWPDPGRPYPPEDLVDSAIAQTSSSMPA